MASVVSPIDLAQESLSTELSSLVLCDPEDRIPVSECLPGYLYYGEGRARAHGLAICHAAVSSEAEPADMQFASRDMWRGRDCLRSEAHFDSYGQTGTWLPYVRLEKVSDGLDESSLLTWLIDQELAMHEDKLAWFKGMPHRLTQAYSYTDYLDKAQKDYDRVAAKRARGISPITELSHSEFVRQRLAEIAAKKLQNQAKTTLVNSA